MKKFYLYIITIAVVMGSIIYMAHLRGNLNYLNQSLSAAKSELSFFKLVVDSLEYNVATKQAELVDMKQLIKQESSLKSKYKALYLKSLESITTLTAEIRILKDSLNQLPDSIIVTIYEKDSTYRAVKLPFEWEYKDNYIYLKSGIASTAQPYFDLKIPLQGEILIGHNKNGPVGAFITNNPYITTTSLDIKVANRPTKWYESKWLYFGMGFSLNYILINLIK